MRRSEDWWAIWIGAVILAVAFLLVYRSLPSDWSQTVAAGEPVKISSPLKGWLGKPGGWKSNPITSIYEAGERNVLPGMVGAFCVSLAVFGGGLAVMGHNPLKFAIGFIGVFCLAVLAYVLAGQDVIKYYNLEYALWALAVGMIISNTIGTPAVFKPAVRTEFYIKTGLVLLGAEVLFSRLLALGAPGIGVAWLVTPVVLISTYAFGQAVLKMESKSLNMVISADMSVCGVSAAIATAAACRAKKEELSFAIGLSLTFTVIMMAVMPAVIKALGMSQVLGGAWMGGTIDSTGAVAAAGGLLGEQALEVAATVKMIQNILIGVTAFGVATYWVTCVEKTDSGIRPDAREIWYRFPKFVLGFVAASAVFSTLYAMLPAGQDIVSAVVKDTKTLRGWFFCLAFVSIGLEINFRDFAQYLKGGKPLILYVCGQSLNLILTLAMSWLMFEVIFKDTVQELVK
ncbi:putative sulfate exporter family transporter [bacterium]|nr:putative sulfate exporter family transporter [bacterium]